MALNAPRILGLDETPYAQWLWRTARRVLALRTEPGLAICWGVPAPRDAKAAVIVPRQEDFLGSADQLARFVGPEGHQAGLTVRQEPLPTVRLELDLLSWFGWFVSRAEEYEPFEPDVHQRFGRSAALAQKLGLMDQPVADWLTRRLAGAIELAANAAGLQTQRLSAWPDGKRFAICLTHDVDSAVRRSFVLAGRKLLTAGAGLLAGKPARAWRRLLEGAGLARGGDHSPYWASEFMARAEDARGLRSASYLIPHEKAIVYEAGKYVRRYDIRRPDVLKVFRRLARQGWEVGLHPSYYAQDAPDGIQTEYDRLTAALGSDVPLAGGRCHYLRFWAPKTWRLWAHAHLRYDASLGWSEGSGFRAGTCWPFRPFDRQADEPIDLWEVGLHLMDSLPSVERILETTGEMIRRAREVGGCACLLYHPLPPSSADATQTQFRRMYEAVVDLAASQADAWVARPIDVVERIEQYDREL